MTSAQARPARGVLVTETILVLGVSLGASAIWSVLSLIRKLTAPGPLEAQTTQLNSHLIPDRPWLDLAYQLTGIVLALVPVLLAVHLLARDRDRAVSVPKLLGLSLNRHWFGRDLLGGFTLAALIGIPGLGLYLAARGLGINTTVAAANLDQVWWAVPVLILAAVQNAVLEEVVMVGYLFRRWRQAGWGIWPVILTSALIRGTYHLYQGFGGFAGNVAMGLLVGWIYTRTHRLWPLIIAHALLDIVAYIGYALFSDRLS